MINLQWKNPNQMMKVSIANDAIWTSLPLDMMDKKSTFFCGILSPNPEPSPKHGKTKEISIWKIQQDTCLVYLKMRKDWETLTYWELNPVEIVQF